MKKICPICKEEAYEDGRMGDGPMLNCGHSSYFITDSKGNLIEKKTPVIIKHTGDPDDEWKYK